MAKNLLSRFGSKKDLVNIQEIKCTIRLLDDDEVLQTCFMSDQKGQQLLDFVCDKLTLLEKDYFGLKFADSDNERTWLDPTRLISKQVKGLNPVIFCFRVKFYPASPSKLKEEITRYYLYLQLRRDLLNRRLYCSPADSIYLIVCIVQSELGDYDEEENKGNYIAELQLIPNQNEKLELEAIEIHYKEMKGLSPAEAELRFLERAATLETYGIDPIAVKDDKRTSIFIGVNHSGILCLQSNRIVNHFKWSDMQKITYESKMFIVHYMIGAKKNLVGFKCLNVKQCQNLWRTAIEQRYFFTMSSSHDIPPVITGGGLFSKQCKLRYSGRVEREILEDMKKIEGASSTATINRRHSINSNVSMTMRPIGRSNTAPLPSDSPIPEGKEFSRLPSQNESSPIKNGTSSEHGNDLPKKVNTEDTSLNNIIHLEDFSQEWDQNGSSSIGSGGHLKTSLATEFNLRPDLTPTSDGKHERNVISFEAPIVRASPSQLSRNDSIHSDSDSTLEEVSEIVDQTPSMMGAGAPANMNPSSSFNGPTNLGPVNNRFRSKYRHHLQQKSSRLGVCASRTVAMLFTALLSALLISVLMISLIVLVFETRTTIFDEIKTLPEVVIFYDNYYEPYKKQVVRFVREQNWI